MTKIQSPLQWVGSKRKIVDNILQTSEQYFNSKGLSLTDFDTLVEPFCGALNFTINVVQQKNLQNFEKFICNDKLTELIDFFKCLRDDKAKLLSYIKQLKYVYDVRDTNVQKEIYYIIRDAYNARLDNPLNPYTQSAFFYFLNKTAFSGQYRVNKHNKFNCSFGNRSDLTLRETEIDGTSYILNNFNIKLLNENYLNTLEFANEHTLYYIDPPYYRETNKRKWYDYELWDNDKYRELKSFVDRIIDNDSHFILSLNNKPFIKELFNEYSILPIKKVSQSIHFWQHRKPSKSETEIVILG